MRFTSACMSAPTGKADLVLTGFNISTGQALLLGLTALAVGVMLWSTRRRLVRSQGRRARPSLADEGVTDVRQQMERLLVELHDVSREMNARLDTKIRVLSALIRDADERIEHLEAAAKQVSTGHGSAPRPPREPSPAEGAPSDADARSAPDGPHERYAEIYALADKGLDAHQIARQTSTPTGEVQLILGLRAKGQP